MGRVGEVGVVLEEGREGGGREKGWGKGTGRDGTGVGRGGEEGGVERPGEWEPVTAGYCAGLLGFWWVQRALESGCLELRVAETRNSTYLILVSICLVLQVTSDFPGGSDGKNVCL